MGDRNMNNLATKKVVEIIDKQEPRFKKMVASNGLNIDFSRECLFAKQQMLKNDYAMKCAESNLGSLQAAILNVAAIGISLNPATAHAYLVPRAGAICLDISYKGLIKLATECGAIEYAKVELVYSNDKFVWTGPAREPVHEADPFSDRGEIKGGYCIAKLCSGDTMVEVMPITEINKIRDTSKARGGPWVDWFEEMAKKTIVKRAYKSWPQTDNRIRLDVANEVLNDSEGMAYTIEQHSQFMECISAGDHIGLWELRKKVDDTCWNALFNSFEKGQKTKNKNIARELESKAIAEINDYAEQINDLAVSSDEFGVLELYEDADERSLACIEPKLNNEAKLILKIN